MSHTAQRDGTRLLSQQVRVHRQAGGGEDRTLLGPSAQVEQAIEHQGLTIHSAYTILSQSSAVLQRRYVSW